MFKPVKIDPDLEDIIKPFVESTIFDFNNLKKFVKARDLTGVKKVCHKILGTALSYGFDELDEIVKILQKEAIANNWADVGKRLAMLESYIHYMQQEYL